MHNSPAWLALGCGVAWMMACGSGVTDDGLGLGGGPPLGGGGDAGKSTALADAGTQLAADASQGTEAGPPPRPTGPGAPPSRVASYTADEQGFFELHTQASSLSYWARLPIGYTPSQPWPLVVGLHGCGDSAQHFATWAIVPYDVLATQSYLAVSVGGRDGGCWDLGQDEAKVLEVVADVRQLFYVHQKKVTLAGYSSGGMLAYYTGLRHAFDFAGILIENSGLPFAEQNQAAAAGAEWKLGIAMSVHVQDANFPIAQTRGDRDLLQGAGFPVQYREVDGDHDGNSGDWVDYLLPKLAGFEAP